MNEKKTQLRSKEYQAEFLYLILAALFISALITCNLITNKFVKLDLGFYVFKLPAGVLPYPITFLITDILSEIYGQKRTNRVVIAGFFAASFALLIVKLGDIFPSITESPVDDAIYSKVFSNAVRIIFASMLAYLVAQLIDVRIFHFWKKLTKGKMLWLRNNASTIFSQLIDSFLVVFVIFVGNMSLWNILLLALNSWFFKTLMAAIDTPFFYAATYILRKKFNLKLGEEIRENSNFSGVL